MIFLAAFAMDIEILVGDSCHLLNEEVGLRYSSWQPRIQIL